MSSAAGAQGVRRGSRWVAPPAPHYQDAEQRPDDRAANKSDRHRHQIGEKRGDPRLAEAAADRFGALRFDALEGAGGGRSKAQSSPSD